MQTIGIVLVAIFGVIFVGLVLYLLIDNLRTGELAMGRTKPLTGSPSSPAATVSSASPLRWASGCSATCGTPWFPRQPDRSLLSADPYCPGTGRPDGRSDTAGLPGQASGPKEFRGHRPAGWSRLAAPTGR